MRLPSQSEFVQVRRLFPVLAAVLFVGALALPMWTIEVHAVQYPNTALNLQLYAYPQITGDYAEMAALNHYIGFYYPDPVLVEPNFDVHENAVGVPEWSLGPLAFVGCAATGLFVALAPTESKLRTGLIAQAVGTVTVFTGMMVLIQYRLYEVGHSLDPDAPVMGVEGFTPPLWGTYEIANITSYSRFGAGAYVSMVAIALLLVAVRHRNDAATPRDLLASLAALRQGDVLGRLPVVGGDDDPGRSVDDPGASVDDRQRGG